MDERKIMADSKVEPLNYSQFRIRITFSLDFFRETKQKQIQITPKQQSLFFSCLSAFIVLRQDFFSIRTLVSKRHNPVWNVFSMLSSNHVQKRGVMFTASTFYDFFKHSETVYSLK